MRDANSGGVSRGTVAELQQARDVLGHQNLRSTGADVLELARQDCLAAFRLRLGVQTGSTATHGGFVEFHQFEVGYLRQQRRGSTPDLIVERK